MGSEMCIRDRLYIIIKGYYQTKYMTLRRTFLSGAWAPANCDDFKNELTPRTETNPAREYEEQAQSGGLNSTGLGWFGLWFC